MSIYSYNRILFSYKKKRATVRMAVPWVCLFLHQPLMEQTQGCPWFQASNHHPTSFPVSTFWISHSAVLASRTSWHWFLSSAPTASLVDHIVKNLPTMRETWLQFPGQEDPPGEGNGNPLQYSCLENSKDRGVWPAIAHGVTKSQTRLSD